MRAFLAVRLDAELQREITGLQRTLREIIERSAPSRSRITWTRPDTIHLTLRFLGDIDQDWVEPLRQNVESATRGHQRLWIPLVRIGAFPRPQAPRTLWVGPSSEWNEHDDGKKMGALVTAIDQACAVSGLHVDEQAWRPHLTLARVRAGEREVGAALASNGIFERTLAIGILHVNAIELIESDLLPGGPRHHMLWTNSLGT
jgi:RNA 2',3'-cyclic 3'-phosphodiesterase